MSEDSITDGPSFEPQPFNQATHLYEVAHARSGDKGDTLNIVVIPFDNGDYDPLLEFLTCERVHERFDHLMTGEVRRYPVPGTSCINFVLTGALDGGVTQSTRFDRHGKTLSRRLLSMALDGDSDDASS